MFTVRIKRKRKKQQLQRKIRKNAKCLCYRANARFKSSTMKKTARTFEYHDDLCAKNKISNNSRDPKKMNNNTKITDAKPNDSGNIQRIATNNSIKTISYIYHLRV